MIEHLQLQRITDVDSAESQMFLILGRQYMNETDGERTIDHEKFLQSILRRQGESDRWLMLFTLAGETVGFAHFKVDRDEHVGAGYVMEFYVVPARRRQGYGQHCVLRMARILEEAGCSTLWLASHPTSEGFWHACGFAETGEYERNKKIMTAALPIACARS